MTRRTVARASTLALAAAAMACTPAGRPMGAKLTPVGGRITDEAIAADLQVFDGLLQRASRAGSGAAGSRRYLAARATEWLTLAQEAYERNDRSAFPEDMIALAERDLQLLEAGPTVPPATMSASVLFPNDVRVFDQETWGRAVSLRRDADIVGAPDEIARAEALLLRAGNRILAGPACWADADASRQANAILSRVEATRVTPVPVDTARQVVEPRPAPVPVVPDSARLPRRPCDAPERLEGVPSGVHFALDRAILAPVSQQLLDRTIAQLQAYPGVRVRLSGHTDPRASNAYNQDLSQRRVDAVAKYLRDHGIPSARVLTIEAFGEERLLVPGTSARDHARNRRVNIVYILCDGSELVPVETLDDLQLEAIRRIMREK